MSRLNGHAHICGSSVGRRHGWLVGGVDGLAMSAVSPISGSARQIMGINLAESSKYLRVLPEEVRWIRLDDVLTYDIISNVNWNIV